MKEHLISSLRFFREAPNTTIPKLKFDLYQEQGVPEYWVVDPYYKTVQIYLYHEGNYIALSPILETDEVQSVTYPDLRFPAYKIFEE